MVQWTIAKLCVLVCEYARTFPAFDSINASSCSLFERLSPRLVRTRSRALCRVDLERPHKIICQQDRGLERQCEYL